MHESAYVGDHVLHLPAHLGEHRVDPFGLVGDQQPGGLELVDDAGQRRAEAVVQVAADPATLLLAGVHQSLPAGLQVLGQAAGAGRGRCLPDHVAEQALVLRRQPAAHPARRQHEPADDGVAVGDRKRTNLARPYAASRGEALTAGPVDLDGDVVDAERVSDSLGDRAELGGPVVDGLQAARRDRPSRRTGCRGCRGSRPARAGRAVAAAVRSRAR